MRDYGKISPQFWTGKTGKAIKAGGPESVVVAMYLMSSPHSNMIGMYYLPMIYLAHETGLGMEVASKGLARALEAGFCSYDDASEVVWVHEMARYQIADELSANDNRVKGIQREVDTAPENPFISSFYEKYGAAFKLTKQGGKTSPFEGASKPLASQEQEQEQDKTLLSEPDDSDAANVVQIRPANQEIPYQAIVDEYNNRLPELPSVATLNDSRKRIIKARWTELLKSTRPDGTRRYADVDSGIEWWGCFFENVRNNPHWMGGNDRGWTATFDWLLNVNNVNKVIEYRPRASA